jgi:vancomycin resistance protein YoaR
VALVELPGREATVSWGSPDLVVRNDWEAALLLEVIAAPSSVTVRL